MRNKRSDTEGHDTVSEAWPLDIEFAAIKISFIESPVSALRAAPGLREAGMPART
jgi:hypothetical protein